MNNTSRLSQAFASLKILAAESDVTIERLREQLGLQSHAFLMLILAFPFMLPIPVPGLSTVLGLIIVFVALSWSFKKPPWVPRKWLKQKIPSSILINISNKGEIIAQKLEFVIKPRFTLIFEHIVFRIILTTILVVCALFLALPLPPGTNFPPGFNIFLIALSILEEDLLVAGLGIALFLANLFLLNGAISLILTFFQSL